MTAKPQKLTYEIDAHGAKIPVYASGVVAQPDYEGDEQDRWGRLLKAQRAAVSPRACTAYLEGLDRLGSDTRIPRLDKANKVLQGTSNFSIVAVEGLIPVEDFFSQLAQRIFPVTWWLREEQQFDYIEEPDLFHDFMGHVPLLTHPGMADFMQTFGRAGLLALSHSQEALIALQRLYWYTAEFGLVKEKGDVKIWGAGILSSPQESVWALEEAQPDRLPFDPVRAMQTPFAIDVMQPTYFVMESLDLLGVWQVDDLIGWADRANAR